ncbi:MAG: hypothetical protein H7A24_12030 [Leptospiraceae bacterium]|nr:hypothetical protein [Leptospiraceae bacterium]MCP5512602.1 hypothetical protein [Leptospiraceae bacterium]
MTDEMIGVFTFLPEYYHPDVFLEIQVKPEDLLKNEKKERELSEFIANYYAAKRVNAYEFRRNEIIFISLLKINDVLLNNAARYSLHKNADIQISILEDNRIIRIDIENRLGEEEYNTFKEKMRELVTEFDQTKHLEITNPYVPKADENSLKYLLKNFSVKLGTRFFRPADDIYAVTVRAYFFVEDAILNHHSR